MPVSLPLHADDDRCWCANDTTRAAALDAAYPDRCRIPGGLTGGEATCVLDAGHTTPCQHATNRPGEPCYYCGGPTDPAALDKPGCTVCWVDLTTMSLADMVALFAVADPDLSLDPARLDS